MWTPGWSAKRVGRRRAASLPSSCARNGIAACCAVLARRRRSSSSCDATVMTQDDIDGGRLVCEIGIAVVKPAEFVILRIGQWRDASLSDPPP